MAGNSETACSFRIARHTVFLQVLGFVLQKRAWITWFFLLSTPYDSATLVLVVQAAIGPRKGLNLPGALPSIAFFLSESRTADQFLKEGAT